MAKKRIFELPETKGKFELSGIVNGTKKDNFYKEIKTNSKKNMRIVNYGLSYDKDCAVYENLTGMEKEKVYFSKKNKDNKVETEAVSWADRFSFNKEGYRLMGVNTGVKKKLNEEGKEVNDKKVLTEFDSAKEIAENLVDGKSVFTKGKIEFSSFTDDKGNNRRSVKLVPNQVSLCSDIDFSKEDFTPKHNFNQVIVFMGIEKEKVDEKETGRAIVSAKIVNYDSIEDAEFIIEKKELMALFKKNLKPYTAIKVSGNIVSKQETETVVDTDVWGDEDEMEKAKSSFKTEFVITGAKPSTIDKETYTQEKIEAAIEAVKKSKRAESDFGSSNDDDSWGDTATDTDDEDFDW